MIDRTVLEQLAGRHLASMQSPGGVSVLLHLHGGARYAVLVLPENRSTIGFQKS